MTERPAPTEDLYELLVRALSDLGMGLVITDSGRCIYANDAYLAMTGYSLDEVLAFPSLLDLSDPAEREVISQRLRDRLDGGDVEDHYEAGLIRRDGTRLECEVSVKLLEHDGRHLLVSLIRDVTAAKKAAVVSEEYRLKLQEAEWRQAQALELNDSIVQGLAVAKMAMEIGQAEMSRDAIVRTLEKAREIVGGLLESMEGGYEGRFVRDRPARLS